jgi:hypothetical protein
MVRYHTLLSLRELGRRAQYLDDQLTRLDELIVPLVTARAPSLPPLHGVGPDTAAILLIAAGRPPRPAAIGGGPGAPVRLSAHSRLLGQGSPAPAQPRRQPPGQPRPVAHRDHPDEKPCKDVSPTRWPAIKV